MGDVEIYALDRFWRRGTWGFWSGTAVEMFMSVTSYLQEAGVAVVSHFLAALHLDQASSLRIGLMKMGICREIAKPSIFC